MELIDIQNKIAHCTICKHMIWIDGIQWKNHRNILHNNKANGSGSEGEWEKQKSDRNTYGMRLENCQETHENTLKYQRQDHNNFQLVI